MKYPKQCFHKTLKVALCLYWRSEKCFQVKENVKKLELDGDCVELGPKTCSLRQSRTKYLEQNAEILWSWTGKEKFGIYFCVVFNCYCQSLISRRETRYLATCLCKFEIFLIFPNFLRSSVLNRSATCEATCIPSLLY